MTTRVLRYYDKAGTSLARFVDRLSASDLGPGGLKAELSEIWRVLRTEHDRLRSGRVVPHAADESNGATYATRVPLIEAMRGDSHYFAESLFDGENVERVNPSNRNIETKDPLAYLCGARLAILTYEFTDNKDGHFHYHLGEELTVVLDQHLDATWWRPLDGGFDTDTAHLLPDDARSPRTLWLKSRIPHKFRAKKGTKTITFFADVLGAHTVHRSAGLAVDGIGAGQIPDAEPDDAGKWKYYYLIGSRLQWVRTSKAVSAQLLASKAKLSPAYVWKLEAEQANPSLDQIVRLAYALDVNPCELCPEDTSIGVVRGCYGVAVDDLKRYAPRVQWPKNSVASTPEKERALVPYLWTGPNLWVVMCSSVVAGSLHAFYVFFGNAKDSSCPELSRHVGQRNKRVLAAGDHEFCVSQAEVALVCLEGSANYEVLDWPETRLFPGLAANVSNHHSQKPNDVGVKRGRMEPESLLYIRPGYPFRLSQPSDPCRLLCVLSHRSTAFSEICLPPADELEDCFG